MNNKTTNELTFFGTCASDSQICQHLYLRGNFQQEMFYDKMDMVNVWNRLWISAESTGTQILSVEILNNHLHINGIFKDECQRTHFKHHFRLSVTQYHNRRYKVNGTLGTRRFNHGVIKDEADLKDCICYHIRNVLHHGITSNYLDYPFSTARYVFNLAGESQKGFYTRGTLPDNLAKAYLPASIKLHEGWAMTREGLIVPPEDVFRKDIVEKLFDGSREAYLEALSHRTTREANDQDMPLLASDSRKVLTLDEQVVEFVKEKSRVPIPAMSEGQKMAAIGRILEEMPKANIKLLTRLFGIPYSTLRYRLKIWHYRE